MSGPHTILVVDDAAMFRDLEVRFLERTGRVLTAENGSEALAVARRERPDVIVLDLGMPDLPGDAVCKEIKADPALREIPVIMVTDGESPEDHARAVRAGADDVLAKPINRIALIQAVNRFVRFPTVRGLTRVGLEMPVVLIHRGNDTRGTARNLSRGGLFVECDREVPTHAEVTLYFELPDVGTGPAVQPTAKVVWSRRADGRSARSGVGLRFLALDRTSAASIDDFVYANASSPGE